MNDQEARRVLAIELILQEDDDEFKLVLLSMEQRFHEGGLDEQGLDPVGTMEENTEKGALL